MMLKKRIIPKLLIKNKTYGKVVRPILVATRYYEQVFEVGDPVSQAKIYEAQLADELIVLNLDGQSISEDLPLLAVIEKLASETFMPLTVGGGVTSLEDFALALEKGADRVSINSAAVLNPNLITQAAERFGVQCVVVSIDFRWDISQGKSMVFTHGGSCNSHFEVINWAKQVVDAGAGEILLTDADRDGTGVGLNLALGKGVTDAVDVPVILAGGCGASQHFVEGFKEGCAEAIAAGTFFCFKDQNPMQTRAHVRNAGIPIRIGT
jgi:imidazole glycerol-phosphate synthase subunit HisF